MTRSWDESGSQDMEEKINEYCSREKQQKLCTGLGVVVTIRIRVGFESVVIVMSHGYIDSTL